MEAEETIAGVNPLAENGGTPEQLGEVADALERGLKSGRLK
jgi:hypothetical protein